MPRGIERAHRAMQSQQFTRQHAVDRAHEKYQDRQEASQPRDRVEISSRGREMAHTTFANRMSGNMQTPTQTGAQPGTNVGTDVQFSERIGSGFGTKG